MNLNEVCGHDVVIFHHHVQCLLWITVRVGLSDLAIIQRDSSTHGSDSYVSKRIRVTFEFPIEDDFDFEESHDVRTPGLGWDYVVSG
jgi:hypothetical protein